MTTLSAQLNRRIRIEKKQVTKDADYGTEVITWVTHAEVWARVLDILSGNQESRVDVLKELKRPCKIQARYNSTITADMRIYIIDRAAYMQIVSKPAEIGNKYLMEFLCEEYQSDGTV